MKSGLCFVIKLSRLRESMIVMEALSVLFPM